ncbi:squalene synthase HpnC [Delftia acidovorans]|uniref:squalene synthase HpnC n=1 Tax=Delftia acidovorans TaxID=80866 RepID=UPI000BC33ADC|nr:squalene synthase HpnC [Delftia acidovorans]ATH14594.1 squalene synthase HpnC [Delftia acidovorans]
MKSTAPTLPASPAPVTHYENFPVASWLCPPRLRPPIAALYHFARTADDLADEGDATPSERLAALAAYRADLMALGTEGEALMLARTAWPQVFAGLTPQVRAHQLPLALMDDLLSAFAQDVHKTESGTTYADRAELLDYCRRSANPVGRLLLHLYGVDDAESLARSDAICTALQLINFWQDFSVDLPRGRHYLTDADCTAHGVRREDLRAEPAALTPAVRALLADQSAWARALMQSGAPLVHRLPGRIGWELRLVVQGGLRILDKVDALQGASLYRRPTVGKADAPLLLWRALRM